MSRALTNIQNRTTIYDRAFEATTSISVGNNVDKNIATGNVTFKAGTTVNLKAPKIVLDAGTIIEKGCLFSTSN